MQALLLLGVVLAAGAEPAPEPLYAGHPLTRWLADLKDPDVLVREEAIEVLTAAGPAAKEAVPLLEKMLRDEPRSLRTRAALALWRIDGRTRPAVEALGETARDRALSSNARNLAIQHLQQLGGDAAAAVPTLLDLIDDPDLALRNTALWTLGTVGKPALPAVLERLGHKEVRERRRAVTALGRLPYGEPEVAPALVPRLTDEDRSVRLQAARLLWTLGNLTKPVVDVMGEGLRNGTTEERTEVLNAVNSILDPVRLRAIRPLLEEALKGTDAVARMRAAQSLYAADGKVEEVLPVLLEGLKNKDRAVWGQAAVGVGKVGPRAAEAVPTLIELFKAQGNMGAFELQEALVRIGAPSVPPLVEMLTSPQAVTQRFYVSNTLGRLGPPAARAVAPLLGHADIQVRQAACQAVGQMGADARAVVPKLAECLKDTDVRVRQAALSAFTTLGPNARAAVPDLIEGAKDTNATVRYQCLMALERTGGDPATLKPVALAALKDDSPLVQNQALSLLLVVDPKNPDILPRAVAMLEKPASRYQALLLVGRMGPAAAKAVPDLAKLLKDPDANLRRNAVLALGQIGPGAREVAPALVELLDPGDPSMRSNILNALRNIGGGDPKVMVPALLKALKDDQTFTRPLIFDLLAEQGPAAADAVPMLLEDLRRPTWLYQVQAASALARIAPERARKEGPPLLQRWLTPLGTRVIAAGAVLRLDPGHKEALTALQAALKDVQDYQRQQAVDALAAVGPPAKEALPALRDALRDRAPYIRVLAAAAVWRVGGDADAALPVLLEGLKAGNLTYVRQQAATKLGDMGPAAKGAVSALLEARTDPDNFLRTSAGNALKKIDPAAAAKAGVP
jgi:HEAT repeat protein